MMLQILIGLSCLISVAVSGYNASSRTNVAAYYGQGPNQKDLAYFCAQTSIDIIPIGFVNAFPAQADGYPGTNFGNRCGDAVYLGPGYDGVVNHTIDNLHSHCPSLNTDIPLCQSMGKTILLSLGGGATNKTLGDYQLNTIADGEYLADFLWSAFGPRSPDWKGPRPFDGTDGTATEVDGFDFDIEVLPNNADAYVALIKKLREHFTSSNKQYLITGAPQCVVPDKKMGGIISAAAFDIIWIQFYNTPACSARTWVESPDLFTYNSWVSFLTGTASSNAKVFIGLAGSPLGSNDQSFYLQPPEVRDIIESFECKSKFGGIMLWEATVADENIANGVSYYTLVKNLLSSPNPDGICGTSSSVSTVMQPTTLQSTPLKTSTKSIGTQSTSVPTTGIHSTQIHSTERSACIQSIETQPTAVRSTSSRLDGSLYSMSTINTQRSCKCSRCAEANCHLPGMTETYDQISQTTALSGSMIVTTYTITRTVTKTTIAYYTLATVTA